MVENKDQEKVHVNDKPVSKEEWDDFAASMREELTHGVVDDALNANKPKEEKSVDKPIKKEWVATAKELEDVSVEDGVDYLSKLTVSLDNVVVLNPLDKEIKTRLIESKKHYLNRDRTIKFVAINSGYSGEQTSVPLGDIDAFKTSDVDNAGKREMLYRLIWKSISSTNITDLKSKFDFKTFLKITSILDVDALLHGIYRAAEIKPSEYKIYCNNSIIEVDKNTVTPITEDDVKEMSDEEVEKVVECAYVNEITIDAAEFISEPSKEIYQHMLEIIHEPMEKKRFLENSPMLKSVRFWLENAKVIVEIKPPSLYEHLQMLKESPDDILKSQGRVLQYALFTSQILFPDVELLNKTKGKEVAFIPEKDFQKQVDFFLSLKSISDVERIKEQIEKLTKEYYVPLKTPKVKCGRCGQVIDSMQIDIEDLLVGEFYKV